MRAAIFPDEEHDVIVINH